MMPFMKNNTSYGLITNISEICLLASAFKILRRFELARIYLLIISHSVTQSAICFTVRLVSYVQTHLQSCKASKKTLLEKC